MAAKGSFQDQKILSPGAVETLAEVKATTKFGSAGLGASAVQWGRGVRKFTFRAETGTQRSVAFGEKERKETATRSTAQIDNALGRSLGGINKQI